jgi:hypothetical protein
MIFLNNFKRLCCAGEGSRFDADPQAPVVKQALRHAMPPGNLSNRAATAVDLGQQRLLLGRAVPTPAFRADDLDVGHDEAPSGLQKETAAFIP